MVTLPFLRETKEGTYMSVKLQPRGSRNAFGGIVGNELKISVTAPPVDSAANEALIELLAERLNCAKSMVQLARGQTSRHKLIFISQMSAERVASLLKMDCK